jgi:predicted flap endonuclease-1-like 5' DNA nuclease
MGGALAIVSVLTGWSWLVMLLALIAAAPGVGAFVQPTLDKYRNRPVRDLTAPGSVTTPAAATAASGATAAAPASAWSTAGSGRVTPVAPVVPAAPEAPIAPIAPVKPATAADLDALWAAATAASESISPGETDLNAIESTQDDAATAVETNLTVEDKATTAASEAYVFTLDDLAQPTAPEGGATVQDLVDAADAETAAAQAQKVAAQQAALDAAVTDIGDDFTRIVGLGRAAERKLKASGCTRYAVLASLPVEVIARVTGLTPEWVIEEEIIKQADQLAAMG